MCRLSRYYRRSLVGPIAYNSGGPIGSSYNPHQMAGQKI